MLQNRRPPKGGLLLAGLAAFAYYKYSKMSEEQKRNLVSGLKEKGQKLYDQYMPTEIKSMFEKKETPGSYNAGSSNNYGEGNNNFSG
jgi:hypothetical protein